MRQDYVNVRFLEWWSYHPRLLKDDGFPSWMKYECGIDDPMDKTVQMIREGYLRVGTPEEQLDQLTVAELKEIAAKQGLSIGKKKQDIIDSIISSGNDEWRQYIDAAVAITDKGLEYIGKKQDLADKNVKSIEEYLVRNDKGKIISVDHDRYAADFNKNTSWFSLINSTLIQEIVDTDIFTARDLSQYGVPHTEKNCEQLKAILIWDELTGEGERTEARAAVECFGIKTDAARMLVRTEHNYLCSQTKLKELSKAGNSEYEYLSFNVEDECSLCRSMGGKIFKISEAKAGVNLPPMHIGCRCSIISTEKIQTAEEIQADIDRMLEDTSIEELERKLDEMIAEKENLRICPCCNTELNVPVVKFCPYCGQPIK